MVVLLLFMHLLMVCILSMYPLLMHFLVVVFRSAFGASREGKSCGKGQGKKCFSHVKRCKLRHLKLIIHLFDRYKAKGQQQYSVKQPPEPLLLVLRMLVPVFATVFHGALV